MKRTEKRSILPKLIVILLMIMLVSTSLLSRTLAKYVTSGTLYDDTARVAKWGVTVTGGGSLFATSYAKDDTTYTGSNTVLSGSTDLVVAPGTSGTLASISLTGTPEVAARILVADNGSSMTGWTYNSPVYEPVVWTLKVNGTTIVDKGTFAALKTALGNNSIGVDPGTDLSTLSTAFEISWEWPFTSGNDAGDTAYGDMATPPSFDIKLNVNVEQID